ncbi:MAG: 3-methyl-2-oxobutanoate dehydrogenase subunit VorB [Anaerolineae bacterium]|nr:3-methyl-2-oxobutanoate dehydrogenase subunit VorB [Anaerolineae bacterium]
MTVQLLKGNVAIAEAAVRAGLEAYFGYPITPQTELLEHLSGRMVELGRVFVQAESEVAAINMVYGAACTGVRAMTSSSSPGVSLMQEGLSYIAASEVPCVVVDMMRGGPGLGNIQPSQADYFQVTRSAGHGDYHPIVLAPASVQEAIDLTFLAFDLADKYRHVVLLVGDGLIGQMMEPAEMPEMRPIRPRPDWAITGARGRSKHVITSINLTAEENEAANRRIQARLAVIRAHEQRSVEHYIEGARVLVIGFGTAGRVAQSAVKMAREAGIPVGLFRPVTLWPFPEDRLRALVDDGVEAIVVVEMNAGQMLEDVRLVVGREMPIALHSRLGGAVPLPEDILKDIVTVAQKLGLAGPETVR